MPSVAAIEDVELYDLGTVTASLLLCNVYMLFFWTGGLSPQSEINVTQEMVWIKIWQVSKNADWGGEEEPEAKCKYC